MLILMRKCKQMAVEWSPLCRPDWPFFIGYWLNLKTTDLLHHHMGQFIYFSEQKGESELFSYKQSFDSVQWLSAVVQLHPKFFESRLKLV